MTMSRSPERDGARLSEVVSIRLTPAEMECLRAVAGGRPLSQFVRELCSNAICGPRPPQVNLNQGILDVQMPVTISVNVPNWSGPVAGPVFTS
jgi:hypothetical protein